MNLTDYQKNILRSYPHRTNLYLSIYRPRTLFSGIVTGTYSTGDVEITYIGASGTLADVYADAHVLVGTTRGDDDVGRIRQRSITSSVVTLAENAIDWRNGQYFTVIDYIPIEPVYPRIIQDPNEQTNVVFYKDYDIPYSNQNSVYGTFPCAGPHRATFASSTGTVYYTATGTTSLLGNSLTYAWTFEGGSPSSSTALTPGYVIYGTPGHYKTKFVVSDGTVTDTTYRYVSVYNRPGEGASPPVLKWELKNLSGSRSEGGYVASFRVFENLGDVEPNALVIVFADDWYGGNYVSLGGNAQRSSEIVFVGYILKDSIIFNYKQSYVDFDVGSVSMVMKEVEGFSVSCESKASPSTWFQLQEMTVPKAIYHYLKWHSTVLKTTDFQYVGDSRLVQYFDADRGSLFDAIDSFLRNGLLGELNSDRQGKLWGEISPFGYENPFSSLPNLFDFRKQDWIETPQITERRTPEMSWVELGGIAYLGVTTDSFSALLSNAPAASPLYHGKSSKKDGLILISQAHLNQIAGNYLAHHNAKYPEATVSLGGNFRNLDIAPQELHYLVDLYSPDTVRGADFKFTPYQISSIEWQWNPTEENLRPDLTLRQVATGTVGQTIIIPDVPSDIGFTYPPFRVPPFPIFDVPTTPSTSTISQVILHDASLGLLYTENFDAASPSWITINAGLTAAQYQSINKIVIAPSGALYVAYRNRTGFGDPFIAYAPSPGSAFTILENPTTILAKFPTYTQYQGVIALGINPENGQAAYVIGASDSGGPIISRIYVGSATSFSAGVDLTAIIGNIGSISYGDDNWRLTSSENATAPRFWALTANGGSIVRQVAMGGTIGSDASSFHIPVSTTDSIYTYRSAGLLKITGNGANAADFTNVIGSNVNLDVHWDNFIACDPTGFFMMGDWNTGRRGKNSDGGATWVGLPNLPYGGGPYAFAYGGGASSASRWVAALGIVRYSDDFGTTWVNKEGNLTSIAPFPDIDIVKVIGF